jgi:predicted dehydrogenase
VTARVRVGVIGTGFGARVVVPVFAATDGCEVLEVVTARDGEAVGALCRRRDLGLVSLAPTFADGWACDVVLDRLRAGPLRVSD